jgi:uncharacterized protein with PIN domain
MKFLCDGMLGTLCKHLRICGIDTAYSNEGLKILIQARAEDRVILTRNTRLNNKRGVLFLVSEDPLEQLRAVRGEFKLKGRMKYLTRCLDCNEKLRRVGKESVRERIPYYTYNNFDAFAECPNCNKVYWRGTHYENMVSKIKKLLK